MNATPRPIPGEKLPSPLRTQRFFRGLTQAQIAKSVDSDEPKISRLENGLLRDTPSTARLKKQVAALFGLTVEELFPSGE